MPRRALPTIAVAPVTTLQPPPPPSPLVQQIRKDWRWAGISQFIWTFSDAFGLLDWDIEALEADLDGDETALIPTLIAKMLYALTYNRQINSENAFEHLRKQYAKRSPELTILGNEEEPRAWAALGLGEKVQILWDLCEWQMADPGRFRALLKSEEEAVSWRIEPVGWDREGNTYYLFDDNRLWVQRLPPAPPRPPKASTPKSRSAKRQPKSSHPSATPSDPAASGKKSHRKRPISPELTPPPPEPEPIQEASSGRRKRTQVAFYGNPQSTVDALKRGSASGLADSPSSSRTTRHSSRHTGGPLPMASTPSKSSIKPNPPVSAPRSTRTSRRSRGGEDEWQSIPAEWLQPDPPSEPSSSKATAVGSSSSKRKRSRKEEEEESELSTLTDEEEHEAKVALVHSGGKAGKKSGKVDKKVGKSKAQEKEDTPLTDLEEDGEAVEAVGQLDNPAEEEHKEEQPTQESDQSMAEETVAPEEDAAEEEVKPNDLSVEGANEIPATGDTEKPIIEAATTDMAAIPKQEELAEAVKDETDEVKLAVKAAFDLPADFIEWEAVCVTLYDWRTFPERFAKSRDPDEKNLYKLLTVDAGPTVIEALVAKEQERLRQEAINNRKRSSRIATKELEKEEILRRERAQREMEERMEKSRRDETARLRAETQAVSQEKAREDRLKEREERLAARENAALERAAEEIRLKEKADRARIRRQRRREGEEVESSSEEEGVPSRGRRKNGSSSRVNTPQTQVQPTTTTQEKVDEGWELDCEICRKSGWNLDDDSDVVCCDDCGKWQHTECHDRQDAAEGRPRRNWDKVDFRCKECRRRAARKRQRLSNEHSGSSPLVPHQAPRVNDAPNGTVRQGVQHMQISPMVTAQPPPTGQQAYTGGQAARAYITAQSQSQAYQPQAPSQPKSTAQYHHQQQAYPGYPPAQPSHGYYTPTGHAVQQGHHPQYRPQQPRPPPAYAPHQHAYPMTGHAEPNGSMRPGQSTVHSNAVPYQGRVGQAYSTPPIHHSPMHHAQTIPHGSSHPFGPNTTGSPVAHPGYSHRSHSIPHIQQGYPAGPVPPQQSYPQYAQRPAYHSGYPPSSTHASAPRRGQAMPQTHGVDGNHHPSAAARQTPTLIDGQQKAVSAGQAAAPLPQPNGA